MPLRALRGRSRRLPDLHEWLVAEVLARHGDVTRVGLDEHAAVCDLDDAPLERTDLHEVPGRVMLARVVRADEISEVRPRAEREDERDAPEYGRGRDGRELNEEVDVDAELVDADDDTADDDDGLREPAENAALAHAEPD